MSLDAMTWAMKHAPIKKTKTAVRNRMVLTYLADRFNDDSRVCWPSLELIAKELDTSKTTVQRSVTELEEQGLIRRANPSIIAHIPEYKRPTVWTLSLHMMREDMGSKADETGVPMLEQEGSYVDHGSVPTLEREGSYVDHLTQIEPKQEPKENPNSSSGDERDDSSGDFQEFWKAYPRKKGTKSEVEEIFNRVAEDAGPEALILGAENFAAECKKNNTQDRYICYPSTFLNQGRWKEYQGVNRGRDWSGYDLDFSDLEGGDSNERPF